MTEKEELDWRRIYSFIIQATTTINSQGERVFKYRGDFDLVDKLIELQNERDETSV